MKLIIPYEEIKTYPKFNQLLIKTLDNTTFEFNESNKTITIDSNLKTIKKAFEIFDKFCVKCGEIRQKHMLSPLGYLNKEHLQKTGDRLFNVCSKCYDEYEPIHKKILQKEEEFKNYPDRKIDQQCPYCKSKLVESWYGEDVGYVAGCPTPNKCPHY